MYVKINGTLSLNRYQAATYTDVQKAHKHIADFYTREIQERYSPDTFELSVVTFYNLHNPEYLNFLNTSGDKELMEAFLENGLLGFYTADLDDLNKNARTFLACMNVQPPENPKMDLSTSLVPVFRQAFTMAVVMANKIEFGEW